MRFRLSRPAAALAAGLTVVVLLAGCVPPDPIITPEPGPGATPVFASDEEALSAATDAYAKYLKVSDEITSDGGTGAERIAGFVSAPVFGDEQAAFKDYQERGLRTRGSSVVNETRLQQYLDNGDGTSTVIVYICVDVSNVRVINSLGEDVTPSDRPKLSPLEVEFEANDKEPLEMTISRSELWPGNDFCKP